VVAATVHACAVVEAIPGDGKVYCWGGNNYGELGVGAVGTAQSRPTQPVNLVNVTSVSAFSHYNPGSGLGGHNCARYVPPNGTAKYACWGRNDSAQLGNTNAPSPSLQPYDIQFAASIIPTQVVVGGRHTCAITLNTHVQCWGANGNGQCGLNNTNSPIATPKSVAGQNPLGAVQLALGAVFTCARLTATGEVACWGNNAHGQLGFNSTNQLTPRKLTSITGVTQLAVGQDFTCGLNSLGLFCWGDDSDKQFGEGTQAAQITPLLVQNVPAVQIPLTLGSVGIVGMPDTNGGHNCAIVANGKLICFGLNDRGQVGAGINTNPVVPTAIDIEKVKQISLGTQFTCATLERGAVRCWGRNDFGQLGNGESIDSNVPVPVKWPDP